MTLPSRRHTYGARPAADTQTVFELELSRHRLRQECFARSPRAMKQNAVPKHPVLLRTSFHPGSPGPGPGFASWTSSRPPTSAKVRVGVFELVVSRSPTPTARSDLLPRPHRQQGRDHQTQHNKQDDSDSFRQKRILFFERNRRDQASANEEHESHTGNSRRTVPAFGIEFFRRRSAAHRQPQE